MFAHVRVGSKIFSSRSKFIRQAFVFQWSMVNGLNCIRDDEGLIEEHLIDAFGL